MTLNAKDGMTSVWAPLLTTTNKIFTRKAEVGFLNSNDLLHKVIENAEDRTKIHPTVTMLNTLSRGVYRFNQYTVECKLCIAPNSTLKTLSYALQGFLCCFPRTT